MLVILLISAQETMYYFRHRTIGDPSSPLFKGLNNLFLLYIFYSIILIIIDGFAVVSAFGAVVPTYYYVETAFVAFLPIYTCYIFTKKGLLNFTSLQKWVPIFIIVGILQYYKIHNDMMELLMSKHSVFDEVTNNAGYILLSIMPALLVFKKKTTWFFGGLGICTVFVLMSMKRGAILISAVAIFLLIRYTYKTLKGKHKFLLFLGAVVGAFLVVRYIQNTLLASDYFNYRLQATLEGDSSEREDIYQYFMDQYLHHSDFLQVVFGRGAQATFKDYGMYAHNDWIEFMYDHGLIGIGVLLYYCLGYYKVSRSRFYCKDSQFTIILVSLIVIIKSFFSMSIAAMPIYISAMLGYALADGFKEQED